MAQSEQRDSQPQHEPLRAHSPFSNSSFLFSSGIVLAFLAGFFLERPGFHGGGPDDTTQCEEKNSYQGAQIQPFLRIFSTVNWMLF